MLIVSVLLALVTVVLLFVRWMNEEEETKKIFGYGAFIAALAAAICFGISLIRVIEPGTVGIPVTLGKAGSAISAGTTLRGPLTDIVPFSVRTETYTMTSTQGEGNVDGDDAIVCKTKDGIKMTVDLSVEYRVDGAQAGKLYSTVGEAYEDKIVRPEIRTAVADAVANYNAMDAITDGRSGISTYIATDLTQAFGQRGLVLERVNLRSVVPDEAFSATLMSKQQAKQAAEAQTYNLQKAQQAAQIRIAEAQGIARSQEIIRATLTPAYLQHEYINTMEKLAGSPNTTFFITPFDKGLVPQFQVSTDKKAEVAAGK